jgi:hypothetical protein
MFESQEKLKMNKEPLSEITDFKETSEVITPVLLSAKERKELAERKQYIRLGFGFEIVRFGKVIHPKHQTGFVSISGAAFTFRYRGEVLPVTVTRHTYDYVSNGLAKHYVRLSFEYANAMNWPVDRLLILSMFESQGENKKMKNLIKTLEIVFAVFAFITVVSAFASPWILAAIFHTLSWEAEYDNLLIQTSSNARYLYLSETE